MFDYLFQTKSSTLFAALMLAAVAGTLVGNPRIWLRLVVFNYGPAFACAFFLVAGFFEGAVSSFDLLAGFVFEFSVLVAIASLFSDALKRVRVAPDASADRWLKWSLVPQFVAAAPLILIDGAGVFSDGSRIAYFHESSAARYLAYFGVLTAYIQAGLLAQRLSDNRTIGRTGYAIFAVALAGSLLSGSKGGFFLWLVATLSMVDYRRIRIRWIPVASALVAVSAALLGTASVISSTLGISELEFAELAAARFYLNNDARALALDFGGHDATLSEAAAASFRGIANALGYPANDPPLGLVLNELQMGVATGNGPNSSLIALVIYYSAQGYALVPTLFACVGVAAIYATLVGFRRYVRRKQTKLAISLTGIMLIHLLSQDFLALPLGIVSALGASLLFLYIDGNRSVRGTAGRFLKTS